MKIKEIIGNLSEVVGRKLNRKKDAEGLTIPGDELDQEMDTKTPEGNKSMLKGQHDTILGISKPVVTGIVIFFFLVFGLAFFYAASDDSGQTEKKTARVEDIADPSRVQGGASAKLSDDYGALERAKRTEKSTDAESGCAADGDTAESGDRTSDSPAARLCRCTATIGRCSCARWGI